MVNVKVSRGGAPLVDVECTALSSNQSIQGALGMQVSYVYFVEVDEDVVVAAVAPTQPENGRRGRRGRRGPAIVMCPDHPTVPLFVMYLALRSGKSVDLTEDLFARAQSERTDMMYEVDNVWNAAPGDIVDMETIMAHLLPSLVQTEADIYEEC